MGKIQICIRIYVCLFVCECENVCQEDTVCYIIMNVIYYYEYVDISLPGKIVNCSPLIH